MTLLIVHDYSSAWRTISINSERDGKRKRDSIVLMYTKETHLLYSVNKALYKEAEFSLILA